MLITPKCWVPLHSCPPNLHVISTFTSSLVQELLGSVRVAHSRMRQCEPPNFSQVMIHWCCKKASFTKESIDASWSKWFFGFFLVTSHGILGNRYIQQPFQWQLSQWEVIRSQVGGGSKLCKKMLYDILKLSSSKFRVLEPHTSTL